MTPGPGLDARVNSSVFAAEKSGIERGLGQTGFKPGDKSTATICEPAAQDYEDATQVPDLFRIKDPTKLATRGWGDDDASHTALGDLNLPVIDMLPLMTMDADQRRPVNEEAANIVITEIGRACEEWGFFQVVNHGIPDSLMDRLVEVAHEFFRLPMEEKQVYCGAPSQVDGYGRHDFGSINRYWSDCIRHTVQPKPAPENDLMPDKPSNYRPLMEEYIKSVQFLLQVLWTSLSQYLGLKSTTLQKAQEDDCRLKIRVNYYPKCPEPEKVLGIAAHKDFGCITVLLQDKVGGLQVQKPGTDVWVDVKPKKGSLVINIANQVEMLSNGRYNSTLHRVLVNRVEPRVSIAIFATPGPKCIISPLQELLDKSGQPARYKQLVYEDYLPSVKADVQVGLRAGARYEINQN